MNICFLSSLNPFDIKSWSGTLYHMIKTLMNNNSVEWIGQGIADSARIYHSKREFFIENYAQVFGDIISERINRCNYDIIIVRDYLFGAFLNVEIPIVYIGDTTFELFKENMKIPSADFEKLADNLELLTIKNADSIIHSSEWAKRSAVNYYGCNEDKVHIVEFGANIPTPLEYNIDIQIEVCNLLFIGKEWKRKGGNKIVDAYRHLKQNGFKCKLTIIGSNPELKLELDKDLEVIPHLDKSNEEDLNRLCGIIRGSHLFVLPTEFEPFGIVFCEASAYGVPSIAGNVGGVSQPVREGKNGYLLDANATAQDYADKIKSVFSNKNSYLELRKSSRHEFETRLNWDVWGEKVNNILEETVLKHKKKYDK